MRNQSRVHAFQALLIALIVAASPMWAMAETKVFVSIPPQKFFLEKIGGNRIETHVMVQPGADAHTYEPRPRQMAALSKAEAYFPIGITFEEVWLPRFQAANPSLRIFPMDGNIRKQPMESSKHAEDSGDRQSEHHHGLLDPHIWTSPPLVKIMAGNIRDALIAIDPAGKTYYESMHGRFIEEIDSLDVEIRNMFVGIQGKEFMVFHPAWGYFADAYGLRQIPVEIEGKTPRPAQLQRLIEYGRQHGIKTIFVQPQISDRAAHAIARELGAKIIPADPLAEDWMANLRRMAGEFKAAMTETPN